MGGAVVGSATGVGTAAPELVDDELVAPAELLPAEGPERLDDTGVAIGIGVGAASAPVADPAVEDELADPTVEGPVVGIAGETPMTPPLAAPGLPPPAAPPPTIAPGDPVGPAPVPLVAGPPTNCGTGVGSAVGATDADLTVGMGVGFVDVAAEDPACLLLTSAPNRSMTTTATRAPRIKLCL